MPSLSVCTTARGLKETGNDQCPAAFVFFMYQPLLLCVQAEPNLKTMPL